MSQQLSCRFPHIAMAAAIVAEAKQDFEIFMFNGRTGQLTSDMTLMSDFSSPAGGE